MKQYLNQQNWRRQLLRYIILPLVAILVSTGIWVAPAQATGIYNIPDDTTWVLDQANALSRFTEGNLTNTLEDFAQETGTEIRMVVFRRLDYGETMDGFTDKILEKWFPEPADRANQVLITLDTKTNSVRLRKGDGVSDLLTDEIAQSVVNETMAVPLQDILYNQACLDASDRLVAVLSGQPDPGPPVIVEPVKVASTFASAEETNDTQAAIWIIVLLVLATIIPMATYFWYVGF